MHLVIAREIDASILATADRIMAAGAHEMGFSVVRFFRLVNNFPGVTGGCRCRDDYLRSRRNSPHGTTRIPSRRSRSFPR
jgi:hypothetical protein